MSDPSEIGRIITRKLRELGKSQRWLGEEVGYDLGEKPIRQSVVSTWAQGTFVPEKERLFAIERALGLKPGQLSRHDGYLPLSARSAAATPEDAIDQDTSLPVAAKRALLAALRELRRL